MKISKFIISCFAICFFSSPLKGEVVFHDSMKNYPSFDWLPLGLPSDGTSTFLHTKCGTDVLTDFNYPFVPASPLTIIVAHATTLNPNLTFKDVPILDLAPDEEISAELKLAFEMRGVENNPYGILPCEQTVQLGVSGLVLLTDTGNTICMFATSNAVYANADSLGGFPNPNGTLSREFISFKKIANLKPGKKYLFKVSYSNVDGKARWFLNGKLKAESSRPLAFPAFANFCNNPEGLPNKEATFAGAASYPQKVFTKWSVIITIDGVTDQGKFPGDFGLLNFGQSYITPTNFLVPFADLAANPSAYLTWPGRSATLSLFDFKLSKGIPSHDKVCHKCKN
ncbi:MAG: DUF6081 family protein [Parachlamydia sp.]|jgi:hypothetical protein|nr:DUF6081 family protein [Parachlamydia sp.]